MDIIKKSKSTPRSCPHSLLEEERQTVIDYALEHPDLRHRKLAYEMQDEGVVYVSPSTIYRILKAENLIPDQEYHQEQEADGEITTNKKNQMWHTDITYIPIKNGHAYLN